MIDFDNSFLSDVKSLLSHQKEDNMASYLYSTPNSTIEGDAVNGEEYYREVIEQNPDYYLYNEEVQLINKVAKKMAAYVPEKANIIEFGVGTEIAFIKKTLPFLKAVQQFHSYIPVDLCETYLLQSQKILKQEIPDILVKPIKEDFIKNVALVKNFNKPVVFFKGSTITNLSTEECIDFLEKIALALQPEGILIVGVDANQNESSLRKAYDTKIGAKFILNTLHLINRDLPVTNFNPYAFKYQPEWVRENYCFQHNVIATSKQEFVCDGASISIEEGEKFHILSSYKYPVEYFQGLAKKAGLEPLDCFVDEVKRMVIHVLGVRK